MNEWVSLNLDELCSITTGDKDVNEGNSSGIYPFFTCAKEISFSDNYSFDSEAILIAGNGNFNVKKYTGKFEVYQRTYVLQDIKIDRNYLFYFIESKLPDITKGNRGSTIRYIRLGDIANYPIFFPSLNEQNRIVEKIETLFSEIDAGVESLSKAKIQLERYRQSLLKHAFEGKLTAQWRAEYESKNGKPLPTADELIEQIQTARQTHYDKQIKEWELAVKAWENNGKNGKKPTKPHKLEEFLISIDSKSNLIVELGQIIEKPKYGTSQKCDYSKSNKSTGVIRIPNIMSNGFIDLEDMKYAEFNQDEINEYALKLGDLLLIRSNGSVSIVGTVGLVQQKDLENIYAGYLIIGLTQKA